MNKLKDFYQKAENDSVLKEKLIEANEDIKKLPPEAQDEAAREAVTKLAEEIGISLQTRDFIGDERAVSDDELEKVAGGAGECIVSNEGCVCFADWPIESGCILIGAYK